MPKIVKATRNYEISASDIVKSIYSSKKAKSLERQSILSKKEIINHRLIPEDLFLDAMPNLIHKKDTK